jgi:hypothetical protein
MNKYTISASVAAVLALAWLAAFAPAANVAGRVSVSRSPISFSLFNPCTNENIEFSGTTLGLIDTTPEDNHFIFHAVEIGVTGIGETSGARYREVFAITDVRQGSFENGPFVETLSIHSRVITAGGGNDLDFDIIFHLTINANGDMVVIFNRLVDESCV